MARRRFKIDNIDDYRIAHKYLEKHLGDRNFWVNESSLESKMNDVENAFSELPISYQTIGDSSMDQFCETHLSTLQYNRLKSTIRATRKRNKDGWFNRPKQIAINRETHLQLSLYAERLRCNTIKSC